MADDPNPDLGRADPLDALFAIAKAAERNADALQTAALALLEMVETARDAADRLAATPDTVH